MVHHVALAAFLPLQSFAEDYTCVAYDRREAGQSGGRVERLTWTAYADQARGLLDHLGIPSACIMGSCLGCSPVIAFAARYPKRCRGLVIAQPSGGVKRRITAHRHFNLHSQYAQENGLEAVVELARAKGSFPQAPESGPWAAVIASDTRFAAQFVQQDMDRYLALVAVSCQALFDRDTIPGAEPEELMSLKLPALILPGYTDFHATSCARYLEECIPGSEYWDVHLESQPPDRIQDRILAFLSAHPLYNQRRQYSSIAGVCVASRSRHGWQSRLWGPSDRKRRSHRRHLRGFNFVALRGDLQ